MSAGFVLLAALVTAGCSSNDDGSATQPPAGTACIPGAQVGCACPGGRPGAQVCLETGAGFGPCMGCDDAGDGGVADGAGDEDDGEADAASEGAGDDAAAASDPCPAGPIALNCSAECGGTTNACPPIGDAGTTCASSFPYFAVTDNNQYPITIRTPDHPGIDPACAAGCGGSSNIVYGMGVRVIPDDGNFIVRVHVAPPWQAAFASSFYKFVPYYYCGMIPASACVAYGSADTGVFIWTSDPNAPSRNVVIELTHEGCLPPDGGP